MSEHAAPPAERERPTVARGRRRWPYVAAAILVGAVSAGIALPVWVGSEAGRAAVARQLEGFVSDGIRGSMTVGRIESISLGGVVGHDVRFTDEAGALVLRADDVELEVEWSELLFSGRFLSPHGRVRGAQVVVETLESGTLLIARTFAPAHPGPTAAGGDEAPTGSDSVRLGGLVASDVEVLVRVHGSPDMSVEHVSAIVLVRAPEHGGVHLRADRIDGEVRIDAPIPVDLALDDGTLTIDGDSRRRVVIDLPTQVQGEHVAIEVRVLATAEDGLRVELRLAPSGPGAVLAAAPLVAQALLAETGSDVLDVTVELR